MMVSCLHKFAALLKEKQKPDVLFVGNNGDETVAPVEIDPQQKELGFLIMELVTCTIGILYFFSLLCNCFKVFTHYFLFEIVPMTHKNYYEKINHNFQKN